MAVLNPLRLVINNWPEGEVNEVEVVNNPENPDDGTLGSFNQAVVYRARRLPLTAAKIF